MPATNKARGSSALPAVVEPPVLEAQIIQPPRAASDMTDAEIGQAAAEAINCSLQARADAVEQAIRAGELLCAAKHRCREQGRSWSDWCRRYWPKSRTTAETYIKVANEVNPGLSGRRADNVSKLLTLESVRALLTDAGHAAGGTRELDEPDGLREPGADEDEDANVPAGDMSAPTQAEQSAIDRLAGQQAQSDAEKAAANRQRREDWKAQKRAEERQEKEEETAEQRMARLAQAAADKARMQAELDAIEEAKNRKPGPEAPRQKPPAPVETLSAGPTCDAMEQIVLSAQRRWSDLRIEPAPMVEKFGRMVMHPRDESLDYVTEWVNAGTEIIRHLQNAKAEDVKVVRAIKRAASAVDA